jgi:CDGSH-type Zn-finger protein
MSDSLLEVMKDGPVLVRGPLKLVDENGQETLIDKQWIGLCRCGQSNRKPFCDGTHSSSGFKSAAVNFLKP